MRTKRKFKGISKSYKPKRVIKENISLNFYSMSLELSNSVDLEYWIENSY
jgi:hypothetical protein